MAAYVDDMRANFQALPNRKYVMCHLMAESIPELMQFARKIGLKEEWFQGDGIYPHFDVSLSKRKLAVENGAIEVTAREMIKIMKPIYWPKKE